MSTIRQGIGWIRTHLKRYAWRLTAAYLWIVALGAIFGFYGTLSYLQGILFSSLLAFLSSIGFEPVNPTYLGRVFGTLWILTITAFKPRELIGLFFYTLLFLFWVPLFLVRFLFATFRRQEDTADPTPQEDPTTNQPSRFFFICFALLVAWFVLYGGATDFGLVLPGIILSGVVFCLLTLRLFSRVRPTTESRLVRFGWLTRFTHSAMVEPYSKAPEPKEYDADKLNSEARTIRFCRRVLLWLARLGSSARGRNGLAMIILAEYIISLIVVTTAAIFFWALVISVAGTEPMSLSESMRRSAEYFFLPTQSSSGVSKLPFWATIGPAATSFILLVVYIGLASSLVRDRQRLAFEELANACRTMRDHAAKLRQAGLQREELKKSKQGCPPKK